MPKRLSNVRSELWHLEDRLAPATFTVSNTLDGTVTKAGHIPGSFRQAIFDANNLVGSDTIVFDSSVFSSEKTIKLTASFLVLSDAVSIIGPSSKLTIDANQALHGFAIFAAGKTGQPIAISNLKVTNAKGGSGVGFEDEALTLTNVSITNCIGGGAIDIAFAEGSLSITDSTITNNTSSNGGAIYALEASNLTITRSVIVNNTASYGGAIGFGLAGGTLYAKDSIFSGNKANQSGGAISGGNVTLENCTIANNWASLQAGAIQASGTLRNCTVAFNSISHSGGSGGGIIATLGGMTLESTIVAKNSGSATTPDLYTAVPVTANNSLIGVVGSATINGSNNILNVDPMLDMLTDNGGPTQTCLLLAGSPAVDKGSNPNNFDYDQRGIGFPRVLNGFPDIGAAEGVKPEPTAAAKSDAVNTGGGTVQTVTVTYADIAAINVSTIGTGDITISGPFGFSTTPTFQSIDFNTDGTPRVAMYEFTPPGNSWDADDNGTYIINMVANQVSNTKGDFVPAGTIGQFETYIETNLHVVKTLADSGPGSLRQAILDSNKTSFADTITFQVGGTIALASDLLISDQVDIIGPGAAALSITRGKGHIFFTGKNSGGFVNPVSTTLSISGLTLKNADASMDTYAMGAAVFSSGTLTLRDCVIQDNLAIGFLGTGGAVRHSGALTIERCTFTNNGVYGFGGAVGALSGPTLIRDSSFVGNGEAGSTQIGAGGGALYATGSITIENCTFTENSAFPARNLGGAVSLSNATAMVRNSTFYDNEASSGGGIYSKNSTLTLQNCTLTSNAAHFFDGTYNGFGGGLAVSDGTALLQGTIVSGNLDDDAPDINAFNSSVAANHSAIGSMTGITNFIDNGNNLAPGTDLKLGSFGNYGGLTSTIPLLASSPAINAGVNAAGTSFDQRGTGFYRAIGKAADIGAFEYQNLPAVVTGVVVNDGLPQRSLVKNLKINFDRPVAINANSFALNRQSDGAPVSLSSSVLGSSVTLFFTGGPVEFGSLADGKYTLTAFAAQINAGNFDGNDDTTPGDDYQLIGTPANGLFRLFGDADGNATVNALDFAVFRSVFGTGPSIFDFNNDGLTNAADFAQFRARFGTSLTP